MFWAPPEKPGRAGVLFLASPRARAGPGARESPGPVGGPDDGKLAVRAMHRDRRVHDMPYHRQAHAEQPDGEPFGVNGADAMSGEVHVRFIALSIKLDGTQGPVHG